jgi:hypothetical protein
LRLGHAALYREHSGSASLISPVLEALAKQPEIACVVLRAGRIYDLEDWVNTPVAGRLVLVDFEESPVPDSDFFECRPTVGEIVESGPLRARLGSPERVEVFGTGIMPFFWDNPAYRFIDSKLVAERVENWRVFCGVLCLSEGDIKARAIVRGNSTRAVEMTFPSYSCEEIWQRLSHNEAVVFRQAIQDGRFDCPICKKHTHSSQHTRCPNDDKRLLGSIVYSSITPRSGLGFALLRESGDDVEFSYHDCQALRVGEENIAVRSEERTCVYEFDGASRTWQIGRQPFKQYQSVRDGIYAIVL